MNLSPTQFATLLTSMNIGDGVTCTIKSVAGVSMPEPPNPESTHVLAHTEFRDTCRETAKHLDAVVAAVNELKISAKAKDGLLSAVRMARQSIESNLPFVEKSFTESTEHTITEAKAEVDAFITGAVMRTGLAEIQKMGGLMVLAERNDAAEQAKQ